MSLQEKLAAARARPATDSTRSVSMGMEEPSTPVQTSVGNEEAAVRELPLPQNLSEPHSLAESLRRSVVSRSVSTNQDQREGDSRRLARAGARWVLGLAALVVGVGFTGILVARQLAPNTSELINVGLPANFEPNSVVNVSATDQPLWIVRSTAYDGLDTIYALQGTCPGTGDMAIWSEETQTFRCPGNASHYAISGLPIKGPVRRALERYRVVLTEDGQIVVDSSRAFREELGQWTDPESFIRLSSGVASLR